MAFLSILRAVVVSAVLFTSVSAKSCTKPEVRKEWRSISSEERACWIDAIQCLSNLPHNPKVLPVVNESLSLIGPLNTSASAYDDFVYTHMDLNVLIHMTGYFFPFHRQFVQTFQDTLRKECGYDGVHPYWDWRIDAPSFGDATIFSDSDYDGLGSWGDPNNDYQINTGGFKDIQNSYPVPHNVRRNYTLQPFLGGGNFPGAPPGAVDPTEMINTTFTYANWNYTLESFVGNFSGFQWYTESVAGPHPTIHIILGGDMSGLCPANAPASCIAGQRWSPNDPMFFLHHGMIDKLWYDWQNLDATNKNAFEGGSVSGQVDPAQFSTLNGGPPNLSTSSVIPGDGLWENIEVEDVMSTTGGHLCYVYE